MTVDQLAAEIRRRIQAGWAESDLLSGSCRRNSPFWPRRPARRRGPPPTPRRPLAAVLKNKRFAVHGTRGWNEAEFTSGGVDAREVEPGTLESKRCRGCTWPAKFLDVQGQRGATT